MHSLPLFHRLDGQPVIVVGDGAAAAAKRRLIERAGGAVVGEDHPGARLAFIAAADPEAAAARLRQRGVLVNVADRPELCDFTVPSVLERGPVVVAVGTGGASAGLAKALRIRLEQLLPQTLGDLATVLQRLRADMRVRWPDPAVRRRVLDAALDRGGALDLLRDDAAERAASWLAGAEPPAAGAVTMTVTSDDPDDLTLRQARLLSQADVLAFEPGITAEILNRARADAVRVAIAAGAAAPDQPGLMVTVRRG